MKSAKEAVCSSSLDVKTKKIGYTNALVEWIKQQRLLDKKAVILVCSDERRQKFIKECGLIEDEVLVAHCSTQSTTFTTYDEFHEIKSSVFEELYNRWHK